MARKRVVIHETTPTDDLFPRHLGRGLDLSARPEGFAYAGTAQPFPDELVIPRGEWQARIQEMQETKTLLTQMCDRAKLPRKNQQQTNFCWCNAPAHSLEIERVKQNEPMVLLSAASMACQITKFKNVGGWGKAALDFLTTNGAVPEADWPNTAIDRKYFTAGNVKKALDYRVVEWWELEPRNLDHLISALLYRMPVAIGLSWWGHEVTAVDPVWLDGTVAVEIDNSWGMEWGDHGRAVLQGSRMLPDDAVCPRTAITA